MGSAIQEVFQGRGAKKGQGFWIKRSVPAIFLLLTWLGLLKNLPVTMSLLWFSCSIATAAISSVLHFSSKRKSFSIEFLFSLALLYAGIIHYLALPWLKSAYYPFVILTATFYGWKTLVPLSLLIPLLELEAFFDAGLSTGEVIFSVSLLLTAIIASAALSRLRDERDRAISTLETIKNTAEDISSESTMESLRSDELISHYFASMLKTEEEIKELLSIIKQALFADSVNFFVPTGNGFALRCSTEDKGSIIITGNGIISTCLKNKNPFYSGEIIEKQDGVGYIKKGKILSLFAVPVMEGSTVLGVLTVDSSRYQAFTEPDRNLVQMLTNHLARIMERERIYPQIKRNYAGLKILQEESSRLVSSLDTGVIAEKLCEGAEKISSSQVFFLAPREHQFELLYQPRNMPVKNTLFDLRGTFINMATESKQKPLYISDIKDYRTPVMPFKTDNVRSFIAIPLSYEDKLLGLLVILSGKKNFLDTFQRELLEVMCNQASTSMANARLHSEIEQLATTDGLTGLYNHRIFQEKLSEEIKKLSRFSEPTSLLLTDIDFFKKVNDTYGHPVGDTVLKGVASVVKETIRDIDIAARYGGEEFAIILPRTDGIGATNIAERLRKTVSDRVFNSDSTSFKVTLSIGISTSPADAKTKEELIERADQALYYAKHNGRNQTVLWSSIK